MHEQLNANQAQRFRVQVGHTTIDVQCRSAEEAVEEARRRLCHEMPRLWDVIQLLEPNRFQVVVAQ